MLSAEDHVRLVRWLDLGRSYLQTKLISRSFGVEMKSFTPTCLLIH